MKKIKRLLIANRGEIVCRIAATCRVMEIEVVTVFAEDDRDLPHSFAGDFSVFLEGRNLSDTYLNIEKLITAAKSSGADAIHPGYGFLSENAGFAQAVIKAGLIFVGPPPEIIKLMGDKAESRRLCNSIGVPVVPGYEGETSDIKIMVKAAEEIGYPVLVKAVAGGGGKGMRIVESEKELAGAISSARSEAMNAFGNGRLLLEKYLVCPRHIEVQVFSDKHGNHVHMFERECSIQRRYQKIVEESPASNLPESVRSQMTKAAIAITSHIGYVGAGTVEFIMDSSGKFYFLEMNTRLQVEHPVTEMVTGLDLVRLQIEVAQGNELPVTQQDIKCNGHAVEVRLYAENPERDFMPSPGTLAVYSLPHMPHVRAEEGYRSGNMVSASYDPMLAKLAAWGESRLDAIRCLQNALGQVRISGIMNNRVFLARVLEQQDFCNGNISTDFIKAHKDELFAEKYQDDEIASLAAAYLLFSNAVDGAGTELMTEHSAWTNPRLAGMR